MAIVLYSLTEVFDNDWTEDLLRDIYIDGETKGCRTIPYLINIVVKTDFNDLDWIDIITP